jgi:hypothetical protein
MDTLTAHTQYTDLRGTAAADEADQKRLEDHLRATKRISPDEHLIAVTFYHSEGSTFVRAITVNTGDRKLIAEASSEGRKIQPRSLRSIRLEMSITQFFGYFKRFNVALVEDGMTGALNEVNIDNLPE